MRFREKRFRGATEYAIILSVGLTPFAAVFGATLRVPDDFPTPKDAIQRAKDGDRILVAGGVYEDELAMKNGMTLEGVGAETVFRGEIVTKNVRDVVFRRFAMRGGRPADHFGLVFEDATGTASDIAISGFHHGVSVERSTVTLERMTTTECPTVGFLITNLSAATLTDVSAERNFNDGLIVTETTKKVVVTKGKFRQNPGIGIRVANAPLLTVRESVSRENGYGVRVEAGTADFGTADDFGRNAFLENVVAEFVAPTTGEVETRGNWWGTAERPAKDRVTGKAQIQPWLTADPSETRAVKASGRLSVKWASLKRKRAS